MKFIVKVLTYSVAAAQFVLYVDVSNDGSFGHVDHELTVVGLRRIDFDLEDSQHISGNRFTDDAVGSVHCLGAGVRQKVHIHVKRHWH